MKILLFGGNGQVGWELQRSLAPLGEVIALDLGDEPTRRADFLVPDSLGGLVRATRPDVIVNAAAYTAVDRAEEEPGAAFAVNAEAVGVLAREAAASGAWLLHYSTDYVFPGDGSTPWTEDAATGPINVYGRSKLAGEERIRASACRHVILRTSWVCAARGDNFARTILRLARVRDVLSVVDDQVGAPTGAELLADVSAHVLRSIVARSELAGTYHAVASGETSWHGYARHVLEAARRHGVELACTAAGLKAIPSADYPQAAPRPKNSRLDTRKLREAFGLALAPWQVGVDRILGELLTDAPATVAPARR